MGKVFICLSKRKESRQVCARRLTMLASAAQDGSSSRALASTKELEMDDKKAGNAGKEKKYVSMSLCAPTPSFYPHFTRAHALVQLTAERRFFRARSWGCEKLQCLRVAIFAECFVVNGLSASWYRSLFFVTCLMARKHEAVF